MHAKTIGPVSHASDVLVINSKIINDGSKQQVNTFLAFLLLSKTFLPCAVLELSCLSVQSAHTSLYLLLWSDVRPGAEVKKRKAVKRENIDISRLILAA